MSKYVRLKPVDKGLGHHMGRFNYRSQLFEAGKWYVVDDDVAEELAQIRELHSGRNAAKSELAFNVCATKAEAEKLEDEEVFGESAAKRGIEVEAGAVGEPKAPIKASEVNLAVGRRKREARTGA